MVQHRKFIAQAEKRVSELDAERAAEFGSLVEAKDRLQRLETEQAAMTSLPRETVVHPNPRGVGFRNCFVESDTCHGGRRTRRCASHSDSVRQTSSNHVHFCSGDVHLWGLPHALSLVLVTLPPKKCQSRWRRNQTLCRLWGSTPKSGFRVQVLGFAFRVWG